MCLLSVEEGETAKEKATVVRRVEQKTMELKFLTTIKIWEVL